MIKHLPGCKRAKRNASLLLLIDVPVTIILLTPVINNF